MSQAKVLNTPTVELVHSVTIELSHDEKIELRVLEARIEGNLKKFSTLWEDTMEALALIDAKQLYRETHESFEAYWQDRFSRTILKELFDDKSRWYNNRRIKALEAAKDLVPIGTQYLPKNEGQARELVPLETAEERQQAAIAAHDLSDGEPTYKHYKRSAQSVAQKPKGEAEHKVGDRVWLNNVGAADHGQEFEVTKIGEGSSKSICYARNVKTQVELPFMSTELSKEPIKKDATAENEAMVSPGPQKQSVNKTSPLESLSFRLSVAEELNQEMSERLTQASELLNDLNLESQRICQLINNGNPPKRAIKLGKLGAQAGNLSAEIDEWMN